LIGSGLYHSTSAIAVRFLSHSPASEITDDLFRSRVREAVEFRLSLQPAVSHRRLIYGESDGLPGTVVDQYDDVLTWTTLSAGIDLRKELFLDTLEELLKPRAIIERNDVALRAKDDLPESTGVLRGKLDGPVKIEEDGVKFLIDVLGGPKTGFFIDQRPNRIAIRQFAKGRRVLDPFCADGGFGLHAAFAGAASVDLADTSVQALDRARVNTETNSFANVSFEKADALDRLGQLVEEKKEFDLVILDPPSFAKSKRNIADAERAYQRLNINALQLLSPRGILATSSCSQAISEEHFLKILTYSAKRTGHRLRLLYRGPGSIDHPVMLSMPETNYLKFFVFQKMGDECP
jgi:23S rRNA (cytosine1962-C5)-methyltransferase